MAGAPSPIQWARGTTPSGRHIPMISPLTELWVYLVPISTTMSALRAWDNPCPSVVENLAPVVHPKKTGGPAFDPAWSFIPFPSTCACQWVQRPSSSRPSPPRRGRIVCRLSGISSDWICRTAIHKTRAGLRLFLLPGEKVRMGASVKTKFTFQMPHVFVVHPKRHAEGNLFLEKDRVFFHAARPVDLWM